MSDTGVPILVFAPFVASTARVEPAWIDYNGHMNMAYYHVLFDRAVDEAFAILGLGPDYVSGRGASYFTAELHTRYLRELTVHTHVRTTVQLVDADDRRVHAYFEIHHLEEGWTAATCEILFVHVNLETRKASPFPDDIRANLDIMRASHGAMPRPAGIGRTIGIRRKTEQAASPETRH